MIVLSENGKVLIDAKSIFISEIKNKEDKNLIDGYRILGSCETSPRPAVLRTFSGADSLKDAQEVLSRIGDAFHGVNIVNNL